MNQNLYALPIVVGLATGLFPQTGEPQAIRHEPPVKEQGSLAVDKHEVSSRVVFLLAPVLVPGSILGSGSLDLAGALAESLVNGYPLIQYGGTPTLPEPGFNGVPLGDQGQPFLLGDLATGEPSAIASTFPIPQTPEERMHFRQRILGPFLAVPGLLGGGFIGIGLDGYPLFTYGLSAGVDAVASPGAPPEDQPGRTSTSPGQPDADPSSGASMIQTSETAFDPVRQCLLGALEAADSQASGKLERMKQAARSITPPEAIAARPQACRWRAVWAPARFGSTSGAASSATR